MDTKDIEGEMGKTVVLLTLAALLSGCALTQEKPLTSQPYFFSVDKTQNTLFDGYKVTYEQFKDAHNDFDRFIIVWEYAQLRKIDISQQLVKEAEEYFVIKAKGNENVLMTELMDSYFKDIIAKSSPKNREGFIHKKEPNWLLNDYELFSALKQQDASKSDAEIYQEIGLTNFEKNNTNRAKQYLKKAVELDPKLYWSWYNLGILYIDTKEGYNYFKKATEVEPKFPTPYYWMAYYHCRNKEDAKAVPLFKKYIELAEGDSEEEGRLKFAKEVLADLLSGKNGQSLSIMRRLTEENE